VQMGVASVLAGMKDRIPGTIVFIFQPAEEGAPPGEEGGAALMVKEGVFSRWHPTAVFGLHTFAQMETGKVGYTPGPAMAASDRFTVNIHGRSAHGASPQLSIDPVVMAAQAILSLQTIRSRNLSPFEPSVVTVGMVRGGERFNIIPADVTLMGTVRTFDPRVQDEVERRMREILDGVTHAGGGSYTLEYQRTTPVTVNDRALSDRMRPTMVRLMGAENVPDVAPTTGAEDFAFFANQVPGFFYRLGTVKPGTTSGDHHTPTFQADDDAIPIGIRMMSTLLLDYLSGGGVRTASRQDGNGTENGISRRDAETQRKPWGSPRLRVFVRDVDVYELGIRRSRPHRSRTNSELATNPVKKNATAQPVRRPELSSSSVASDAMAGGSVASSETTTVRLHAFASASTGGDRGSPCIATATLCHRASTTSGGKQASP
jgi:amidohydrolase